MSEPVIDPDGAFLQSFLRDRDVACPRCDYNLRNLAGQRCPECGDELVLKVNLAEPKIRAVMAGLVALASAAGLNGLLVIYGLAMMSPGNRRIFHPFFLTTGIGALFFITALAFWLKGWRSLVRSHSNTRLGLAIVCWLAVATDLIMFCKYIK